jgi:hypothetical protein
MTLQTLRSGILAAGVAASLAACGGGSGDPEPDPAPTPAPGTGPLEISISPHSGSHGSEVTVRASGFEAGARVGIGIGPPQSEYDIFTHATADAEGTVTTTVEVPDWTEPGRDYLFAAQAPDGADVISSAFRVTPACGGAPDTPDDEPAGGDRVTVTGELTDEGVECPALRGEDGRLYTLAGEIGDLGPGDRVRVEGTVAEMSFCMQGTTIQLESIRRAD